MVNNSLISESFPELEYELTYLTFGVFSLFEVLIQILMTLMGFGLYMGISRFYWDAAYKDHQKSMFLSTLLITIILAFILGIVMWLGAPGLSRFLFEQKSYAYPLKLAVVSAGLQAILLVALTLLKLQARSGYYSAINILRGISTLGFTYLFVLQIHQCFAKSIWHAYAWHLE